jgi:hypothetical protein
LQCSDSSSIATINKPEGNSGTGSQELAATHNKINEVKTAYLQLAKRQRRKPAPRNQDFVWTA